jgi:hypothetical protein
LQYLRSRIDRGALGETAPHGLQGADNSLCKGAAVGVNDLTIQKVRSSLGIARHPRRFYRFRKKVVYPQQFGNMFNVQKVQTAS